MKVRKIFIIAGEQSGDNIGATIIKALQNQNIEFTGIVGDKMIAAGAKEFAHIKALSVMGFTEVIFKLFSILKLFKEVVNYILENKPDIVITIDSPDFSMRVLKKCYSKLKGTTKFYHVVAPTVWAYREHRAKTLSQICDGLFCLFPFEVDYFTKYGLKTTFIGHPILEEKQDFDITKVAEKYKITKGDNILILMPGSRKQELKRHWGLYLETVNLLRQKIPDLKVFALLTPQLIPSIKKDIQFISDESEKKAFFKLGKVGLIKSGTASIETSYYGLPIIVTYKVSTISALLIKKMIKVGFVSIINIIAKKQVVPEFLQENATPEKLSDALYKLMQNPQSQLGEVAQYIHMIKAPNGKSPGEIIAENII